MCQNSRCTVQVAIRCALMSHLFHTTVVFFYIFVIFYTNFNSVYIIFSSERGRNGYYTLRGARDGTSWVQRAKPSEAGNFLDLRDWRGDQNCSFLANG